MFHLVYASTATRPFTDDDAAQVLGDAQAFNAAHGVSGLLVHCRDRLGAGPGLFLQVLEGEREAVEAVYAKVASSGRHTDLRRTPAFEVAARVFPQWAMGFERALPGQLVDQVLSPLVHHRLVVGAQVRDVLLERWGALLAA